MLAEATRRLKAKNEERTFVTVPQRSGESTTGSQLPIHHPVPPTVARVPLIGPNTEKAAFAAIQSTVARSVRYNAQGGVVAPRKKQQLREHLMRPSNSNSGGTNKVSPRGENEVIDGNSSEEDCGGNGEVYPRDDYRADHLLHLVAKEECLLKMGRRNTRSQSAAQAGHHKSVGAAASVGSSKSTATAAGEGSTGAAPTSSAVTVRPSESYSSSVPFTMRVPVEKPKSNTLAAIVPDEVARRELERVLHSQVASNITMTISDTMLKPDFFGPNNEASFGMSTSLQATRPIVSNTKFFRAVNEDRKKRQQAAENAGGSAGASSGRSNRKKQKTVNGSKRAKYLDEMDLSEEDSDQEKEDSAILTLLGE